VVTSRVWLSVAILLALADCRDAVAPLNDQSVAAHRPGMTAEAQSQRTPATGVEMLQQAPTAPPLRTYRVSFWAHVGKASLVTVTYQPAPGQWLGQPFLSFYIPKNGLVAGADGAPLKRGDSVSITLTIDSVSFSTHFEPSGVLFSKNFPANLTLWYENANLDLNGNGVVDGWDWSQLQQLAFWYHTAKTQGWSKLPSTNDTQQTFVSTALYHFSEYALSW
jgi:hypothetical protein